MSYGYYYLITASAFLFVMLGYFTARRSLPDFVERIFETLIIFGCLNNLFGLVCTVFFIGKIAVPDHLVLLGFSIYLVVNTSMMFLLVLYSLSLTGRLSNIRLMAFFAMSLAAMIHLWIVGINPPLGLMFTSEGSGTISYGRMFWVHPAVNLVYIFMFLITTVVNRKYIEKSVCTPLYAVSGILTASEISCLFFRNVAFSCVVNTAVIIILYLANQNFEKKADIQSRMFSSASFIKFMQQQLADRKAFYFLGIKIRNLDKLNRILGVDNCDKLTTDISNFLYHIPERCVNFRISSNTFAIVTNQPDRESNILKILENRFSQTWRVAGIDAKAEISLASMEVPRYAGSFENILANLEYCYALLENDSSKGNFVCVDEVVMKEIEKSIAIENAIKNAIKNKSFEVVYQPIYSVSEKRTTGAEALVRLYDEKLGSISPDVFIPLAEKNGNILKIDRIVFEKVCEFISENHLENYGIEEISVNLSTVECMQGGLGSQLIETMDRYGIPHNFIRLEITETAAVNSYERLISTMQEIADAGCTIALDDYGTGYSNLNSILRFPFGVIKLDRSLIWTYDKDPHSAVILSHIEKLARKLDMKVLAEGVETEDHKNLVENIGVDYIQGYYFSRPLKESYFIGYLKNSKKMYRNIV